MSLGGVLEVFLETAALGFDGAFAIDLPRPRAVDGLAVDLDPGGHLLDQLFHLGVERAVRALDDVEQVCQRGQSDRGRVRPTRPVPLASQLIPGARVVMAALVWR